MDFADFLEISVSVCLQAECMNYFFVNFDKFSLKLQKSVLARYGKSHTFQKQI